MGVAEEQAKRVAGNILTLVVDTVDGIDATIAPERTVYDDDGDRTGTVLSHKQKERGGNDLSMVAGAINGNKGEGYRHYDASVMEFPATKKSKPVSHVSIRYSEPADKKGRMPRNVQHESLDGVILEDRSVKPTGLDAPNSSDPIVVAAYRRAAAKKLWTARRAANDAKVNFGRAA